MKKQNQSQHLEIIRQEINIDTQMHFVVLEFESSDPFSSKKQLRVARSELTDTKKLQQRILDYGGAKIVNLRSKLDKILNVLISKTSYITNHTGWYHNDFVTRNGTIHEHTLGKRSSKNNLNNNPKIFFDTTHPLFQPFETSGSLDEYKKGLSRPLKYSRYLRFILSAALAAPMADFLGRNGGMAFNFSGPSSSGKTLSLRTILSTVNKPMPSNLVSFNYTQDYLRQNFSAFGGLCIPFSDIKTTNVKHSDVAEKIQALVFANNDGIQRQSSTNKQALLSSFSILIFNSERPIAEFLQAAKKPMDVGDKLRLIDIPVPEEGGIFDIPNDDIRVTSAILAEELDNAISNNYGFLIHEWAILLTDTKREQVRKYVEEQEALFLKGIEKKGNSRAFSLNSELRRMAKTFALIAAAGSLAAKKKILPISSTLIFKALIILFQRASKLLLTRQEPRELQIKTFEAFIKNDKNFPLAKEGTKVASLESNQGFRRREKGKNYLYIRREKIDEFIHDKNYLERVFFPELEASGALIRPKNGWTFPVKQKGLERQRFVKLRVFKLQCS